jgi:hypothetical protein
MAKMNKEGKKAKMEKRQRHSARKWIVQALESADASVRMRTSEIQRKASKLAGSDLPGYSVYQALRTLVKREVVAAKREGRELTYQFKARMPASNVKRGRPATVTPTPALASTPAAAAPAIVAASAPAVPAPTAAPVVTTTALARLDTLAPGEIALLHIGETPV